MLQSYYNEILVGKYLIISLKVYIPNNDVPNCLNIYGAISLKNTTTGIWNIWKDARWMICSLPCLIIVYDGVLYITNGEVVLIIRNVVNCIILNVLDIVCPPSFSHTLDKKSLIMTLYALLSVYVRRREILAFP